MIKSTWLRQLARASKTGGIIRSYSGHEAKPNSAPPWRPGDTLDEWVQREARPISLRQLTVFGRTLTEARLLSSANYVRLELPTRIAHRLRDMQILPYTALTNRHISHVHELYYSAFERLRRVPEVRTLEDNKRLCEVIRSTLHEHLSVIPSLAMGVLEIRSAVPPDACDQLMTSMLRSRISRRVIAEQHLALTETFHSPQPANGEEHFVGRVLLKCSAADIVSSSAAKVTALVRRAYGPNVAIPQVHLEGDLSSTFPYIPSHIEYIIGELLRNSIQASLALSSDPTPPPIEVLVCEAAQHLIIRVSDRAGGVDPEVLPYLWSFARGPRKDHRLRNLGRVPRLAGTAEEVVSPDGEPEEQTGKSVRPPDLRLGIGLPISRVYAEYWAGSLELHSLEGYGTDAFLQVSKLGNRNETLSTRASMDAL